MGFTEGGGGGGHQKRACSESLWLRMLTVATDT